MSVAVPFTVTVGSRTFTNKDEVIGLVVRSSGNKSVQDLTLTVKNQAGLFSSTSIPARAPVTARIAGYERFVGTVSRVSIGTGHPAKVTISAEGQTAKLRDIDVRPLVYSDDLTSEQRDGPAQTATISGGRIEVPASPQYSPIDEVLKVEVDDNPVAVLNIDKDNGVIYVDQKHNGESAKVSYTVFKPLYSAETATAILTDLYARYAPELSIVNLATISTTLTYEPGRSSDLFRETGNIRDYLGGAHEFFLDTADDLTFQPKTGTSVRTFTQRDVLDSQFSIDSLAYANQVVARTTSGIENSISQAAGIFPNIVEGLTPTSTEVDAFAQGFQALSDTILDFSFLAKRNTLSDALDVEVQYNGSRGAIDPDFTTIYSLTPDSDNIRIDQGNDDIEVQTNGSGNAYLSAAWVEDLTQDASSAATTISGNIYQTITVSDLTNTLIKGIGYESTSTSGVVSFEIYSGTSGNTGTLLGTSETVDQSDADNEMVSDWFAVYFDEPVDVSGETNISIVAVADSGTPNWRRSTADPYAGGQASTAAGDDFTFQIYSSPALEDVLAAVATFTDDVTDSNKQPQYFIARNYAIGQPDAANWHEVINGIPVLFDADDGDLTGFGVKIAFNSASTTTDPLVEAAFGSSAYLDPEVALNEPSGIVVGDLSTTIGVDDLPFYNIDLGTFTEAVGFDGIGRIEPDGNYWLIGRDGTQDNGISHFTVFYDDGADDSFFEPYDDETNINTETDILVEDSMAAITPFTKFATAESTAIIDLASDIDDARVIPSATELQGRAMYMVSRNQRNYYYPGRSTDTSLPAMKTGELCILQFDDGDYSINNPASGFRTIADQSGNGFGAVNAQKSFISVAGGKYGDGWTTSDNAARDPSIPFVNKWLQGDWSAACWVKPDSLADDAHIIDFNDGTTVGLQMRGMSSGAVKLVWTDANGANTRTFTSSGTPLTVGVWTHVAVSIDRENLEVKLYLDKVLDTNHSASAPPDTVVEGASFNNGNFNFMENGEFDGTMDELRIWPRTVEDWVIEHVADYPYDDSPAKFTFPTETDNNDTFTSSESALGDVTDLYVAAFLWPAPFQQLNILLRSPFNRGNSNASRFGASGGNDIADLSSYGHTCLTSSATSSAPEFSTDGLIDLRADFDGTADRLEFQEDGLMSPQDGWTWAAGIEQDATSSTEPLFHKGGELTIELTATDASTSTLDVDISVVGGSTRSKSFTGISLGTGTRKHLAVTYDKQILTLFVDGSSVATEDFGSIARMAKSTENLFVGHDDASAFFNGKMDNLIYADEPLTAAQIALVDDDMSSGLRSPVVRDYTASAYAGSPTTAYADGKYLVSRDNEASWVDTLDGSTSNAFGSLAFVLRFGKDNLQCIRRNETEVTRVGRVISTVIEVPATDLDTLCTIAEGYLDLLDDGLDKGRLTLPWVADLQVGDIVTVNIPSKGQLNKEYAVAQMTETVEGGRYIMDLEIGEEERALPSVLGSSEVNI